MRERSELTERELYAGRFIAVLAVECLCGHDEEAKFEVIVEAEDERQWDDVLRRTPIGCHRFQVRRQQTNLSAKVMRELLEAMQREGATTYHLVVPVLVDVEDAGPLRVLQGLLRRIHQDGADQHLIIQGLRKGEREWVDFIRDSLKIGDEDVLALMKRTRMDIVGYEGILMNVAFVRSFPTTGMLLASPGPPRQSTHTNATASPQ